MAEVTAQALCKSFHGARGRRAALDGVSFRAGDGQTLVVLGPSGAGKSTLLRVLAGLEAPDSGVLRIGQRDVLPLPAHDRRVALVFQDDALFPHLSIYDNLAFSLRVRGADSATVRRRVGEVAALLSIDGHLRERPARLSGGERQRAAIARAVLNDPHVLLLDEPLSHLDPQLRVQVRAQFVRFRKHFAGPVVYVTHDHTEALTIADRLAILIDGRIAQCDEPQRVYDAPADVRVAAFLGSPPMNLLDDGATVLGIRPEHVRLSAGADVRGTILACERTGADCYVRVASERGELSARVPQEWHGHVRTGERIGLIFPAQHVCRFDAASGVLLPGTRTGPVEESVR